MSDSVMASPDVALKATLGSFGSDTGAGEGGGQADAPSTSDAPAGGAEKTTGGDEQPGTEKPDSTTPDAPGEAKPDEKAAAEFPDEYKPFKGLIEGKKWDPKAKEFVPTLLKSYGELEKSFTQSNQDKSFLNSRTTELQRRAFGDAKSVNELRKLNGLPELPIAKTYSDQVKEKSEMFSHLNAVLSNTDKDGASFAWLNKHFEDLPDLRARAANEADKAQKPAQQAFTEFRGKSSSLYTEHLDRNGGKDGDVAKVFDKYVAPLFMDEKGNPGGLLGSYGLDVAHMAMSPEHVKAWEKIGRALQLAESYDKTVEDGVKKGVDAAMESKRKAGNAGSVGSPGKKAESTSQGLDPVSASLWKMKHS